MAAWRITGGFIGEDLPGPFTFVELAWKISRVLACFCIPVSVMEKEII